MKSYYPTNLKLDSETTYRKNFTPIKLEKREAPKITFNYHHPLYDPSEQKWEPITTSRSEYVPKKLEPCPATKLQLKEADPESGHIQYCFLDGKWV